MTYSQVRTCTCMYMYIHVRWFYMTHTCTCTYQDQWPVVQLCYENHVQKNQWRPIGSTHPEGSSPQPWTAQWTAQSYLHVNMQCNTTHVLVMLNMNFRPCSVQYMYYVHIHNLVHNIAKENTDELQLLLWLHYVHMWSISTEYVTYFFHIWSHILMTFELKIWDTS